MNIPILKNKTTNSLPKMTGDTGYGLGFFCGCLVGVIGTYLVATPEGRKLKDKIYKEYQANQQTLTLKSLMPDKDKSHDSETIKAIRSVIASIQNKITSLEPGKSAETTHVVAKETKGKHYFKKK